MDKRLTLVYEDDSTFIHNPVLLFDATGVEASLVVGDVIQLSVLGKSINFPIVFHHVLQFSEFLEDKIIIQPKT